MWPAAETFQPRFEQEKVSRPGRRPRRRFGEGSSEAARGEVCGSLLRLRQQRLAVECFGAAVGADGVLRALVHGDARVVAARVEYVELYAEARIAVLVQQTLLDRVGLDA